MGDIDHIISRFSGVKLEGSQLELSLEQDIWDSSTDSAGQAQESEYTEWHVYFIVARESGKKSEPIKAEIGRTLYSKQTRLPHDKYAISGDMPTIYNLAKFLNHLKEHDAKANIVSDNSKLFLDVGTFSGYDLNNAVLKLLPIALGVKKKSSDYSV